MHWRLVPGTGQTARQRVFQQKAQGPIAACAALHQNLQDLQGQLVQPLDQAHKKLGRGCGVGVGPVGVVQADVQAVAEFAQVVAGLVGQQNRRQFVGVQPGAVEVGPVCLQKAQIEAHIVADNAVDRRVHKGEEFGQHPFHRRCASHVPVRDIRQLLDENGDGAARIDESGEGIDDFAVAETDRTDFDDGVFLWAKPGGFHIHSDKCTRGHRLSVLARRIEGGVRGKGGFARILAPR